METCRVDNLFSNLKEVGRVPMNQLLTPGEICTTPLFASLVYRCQTRSAVIGTAR